MIHLYCLNIPYVSILFPIGLNNFFVSKIYGGNVYNWLLQNYARFAKVENAEFDNYRQLQSFWYIKVNVALRTAPHPPWKIAQQTINHNYKRLYITWCTKINENYRVVICMESCQDFHVPGTNRRPITAIFSSFEYDCTTISIPVLT